jgi:hypothetical protein
MNFTLPPYGRKESFNLVRDIIISDNYATPTIIEIGMTRTVGNWIGDGYSTPFFGYLVNVCEGELYSIDIDPSAKITCESILRQYGLYTDRVHLITEDGIFFLEQWSGDIKKPVDLLYLDGCDYGEGPLAKLSEDFHLKAFKAIEDDLSQRALVLIDDVYDTVTFKGKGRLVIPYLFEHGYKPLHLGYQCLFSRKEIDKPYKPSDQVSEAEAKNIIDEIIQQAHEEALKDGTLNLPANFSEILLQKEPFDAAVKGMLAKKRHEGVRDDDIRWWWNMDDIERRMIIKLDTISNNDEIQKFIDEYGFREEEAKIIVRKTRPIFGDLNDFSGATGDDLPLPYELIGRINNYIRKILQENPDRYRNELKHSSTFNAFLRREIREGNL